MESDPSEWIALVGDQDPIEILTATPIHVEALVLDPRFDPDRVARPGAPSGRAIVARLVDREVAFAYEARQAVAGTHRPEVGPPRAAAVDGDAWGRDHHRMDPSLALASFGSLRGWNLAWLARRDLADWWATMTRPDGSALSVDELVRSLAGHDVTQLERLAALLLLAGPNEGGS